MTRYRLLKELPGLKPGAIFIDNSESDIRISDNQIACEIPATVEHHVVYLGMPDFDEWFAAELPTDKEKLEYAKEVLYTLGNYYEDRVTPRERKIMEIAYNAYRTIESEDK
jgi:hypothetical protein